MDLKKTLAEGTAKYLKKFFRRKTTRHLGNNRFLPVDMQADIMAAAEQKRMRRDDARKVIYHQQTRLGLFK